MSPYNEQHAIPARTGVARRPLFAPGRLPGALPALGDALLLLTVLGVGLASIGSFVPTATGFVFLFLTLQLWPEVSNRRLRPSVVEDVGPVARRAAIAFGTVAAVSIAFNFGGLRTALFAAVVAVPLVLSGRAVSYAAVRSMRSREAARTLVVGAGDVAKRIVTAISERSEYGMEVVGAIADDPMFEADVLGTRILGAVGDLADVVRSHKIEKVIVAFSSTREAELVGAVRAAVAGGAEVWFVPRLFELGSCAAASEHLWGFPIVKVAAPADLRPHWGLKRAFDVVAASICLLLAMPIFAVCALAILLESGRPILFRQERVGAGGRLFSILKFRTMTVADRDRHDLIAKQAEITRVGRFLRDKSFDELPQLVNVLKGEMSLVGPRPEDRFFVDRFSAKFLHYGSRHRLPVGITGWAQIHGLRGDRADELIDQRAALDNYYIDNWSLGRDVKILLKTIPAFIKRQEG